MAPPGEYDKLICAASTMRAVATVIVAACSHFRLHTVVGLLQLRYEHDSSTIRVRFEHDSATTRYNTLRGFSCARIRDRFEHSTGISGRRVLHVDRQLNAHNFYFILMPTLQGPTSCV